MKVAHDIDKCIKSIGYLDDVDIGYAVKKLLRREQSPSLEKTLAKLTTLANTASSMNLVGTRCFISEVYEYIEKVQTI